MKSADIPISASDEQSILVSIPVSSTYFKHGENYKVIALINDAALELTGKCIYIGGKFFVEAYTDTPALFIVVPNALGIPFDDLEGHWSFEAVKFVYQNKFMNGISDKEFSPDTQMNRAMLVTVLYRMENSPEISKGLTFSDVEPDSWYEKAVMWASEQGITNGYGENIFAPYDDISREQIAAILMRYAEYKNFKTTKLAKLDLISDVSEISDWASKPMQWAYAEGLITGKTTSFLYPKGLATRGEVATMLMRFCQNIVK